MRHKLYDLVKDLLIIYPELRDSDKKLRWQVWKKTGFTDNGIISYESYLNAPDDESIRRCRQKICERHPELKGNERVEKERQRIAKQKGTFIYREPVQVNLFA